LSFYYLCVLSGGCNVTLFVGRAQVFPALQRDRNVAVFPDEIVEGAEIEFSPCCNSRIGKN